MHQRRSPHLHICVYARSHGVCSGVKGLTFDFGQAFGPICRPSCWCTRVIMSHLVCCFFHLCLFTIIPPSHVPPLPSSLPPSPLPPQPAKKKARRLARKAKAAAIAPRPTQLLRPVVHPPTQRYNHKTRLGKGFSMQVRREGRVAKGMERVEEEGG